MSNEQQDDSHSKHSPESISTSDAIMANQLVLTCLTAMFAANKSFPLEDFIGVVEGVVSKVTREQPEAQADAVKEVVNRILAPSRGILIAKKAAEGDDGEADE